jgi:indole-3-acetate monooxygenase
MSDLLAGVNTEFDSASERVHLRLASTFASETALSVVGQLTEIAGAVSILQSCPLERFERDARAAAKHISMSPASYILGGQLALGLDRSQERI